jgi:beta-xylosidase
VREFCFKKSFHLRDFLHAGEIAQGKGEGRTNFLRNAFHRASPVYIPRRMNFRRSWLAFLAVGVSSMVAEVSAHSAATNSAKTYRNPLLPQREMADPDVIRVEGHYFLYATSDTRGYEVLESDDLVNWQLKGWAFEDPRHGAWAPDVFNNQRGDHKFYLYYTDNLPKGSGDMRKQIGVAVAESPLGPFKDKRSLATNAIDAHLFQDDDKSLYLYYVDLTDGFKIVVQTMSDAVTKMRQQPKALIWPTEEWEVRSGHVTEGPFMLKRNCVYYLMYSGSGADTPNYGIGYATSNSPLGPFKKFEGNPIVHREGKVLGPGHHCVIEGPDHKLWLVYHQKWNEEKGFHRFLAIDPLWFDDKGVIHAKASRETDEPAP